MPFESIMHAANHEFARSTREAVRVGDEGSKKQLARDRLRDADIAERSNDEVGWILAVARAARALE